MTTLSFKSTVLSALKKRSIESADPTTCWGEIDGKKITVLDAIKEIEGNTELGKKIQAIMFKRAVKHITHAELVDVPNIIVPE